MEEFVSVEDVKRVFKAFCSKEISGCGSEEQECEDCIFYKKYVELLKEKDLQELIDKLTFGY